MAGHRATKWHRSIDQGYLHRYTQAKRRQAILKLRKPLHVFQEKQIKGAEEKIKVPTSACKRRKKKARMSAGLSLRTTMRGRCAHACRDHTRARPPDRSAFATSFALCLPPPSAESILLTTVQRVQNYIWNGDRLVFWHMPLPDAGRPALFPDSTVVS